MKPSVSFLIRYFSVCALVIIALGILGFVFIDRITAGDRNIFSRELGAFMSRIVEATPRNHGEFSIDLLEQARQGLTGFRYQLWIVDEKGKTLSSSRNEPLPEHWENLPRPETPNEMEIYKPRFALMSGIGVIRLPDESPVSS